MQLGWRSWEDAVKGVWICGGLKSLNCLCTFLKWEDSAVLHHFLCRKIPKILPPTLCYYTLLSCRCIREASLNLYILYNILISVCSDAMSWHITRPGMSKRKTLYKSFVETDCGKTMCLTALFDFINAVNPEVWWSLKFFIEISFAHREWLIIVKKRRRYFGWLSTFLFSL